MPGMDLDTYKELPSLGPLVMVELRAIHLHRHLHKSPLTIEVARGECRISKSLMALARKAHANLLGGLRAQAEAHSRLFCKPWPVWMKMPAWPTLLVRPMSLPRLWRPCVTSLPPMPSAECRLCS